MAKGDYYFPLYYKKLLTSTIGWKDDEFGAYVRLLIHQFDKGKLPGDFKELSLLCTSLKKNKNRVLKKFKETEDGHLINEVMDDIYHSIQDAKSRSKVNGKKGGRPKNPDHNLNETPGLILGSEKITQTKPIPIINNQESKESTEDRTPDIFKSNLFRQPKIPTKAQVWEVFMNHGGTKEMALSFWNKHEATGWFINGSPIVNISALASKFITNWNKNEKNNTEISGAAPLKKLN
jgi:uncharacterized protein YdaU (DUF1376 family)